MNKSCSIWPTKRAGKEEEETEEQQAARTAEFHLGVKRRDALRGLSIAVNAAEKALGTFQAAFPGLTDLVEHQEGVEKAARTVERVSS